MHIPAMQNRLVPDALFTMGGAVVSLRERGIPPHIPSPPTHSLSRARCGPATCSHANETRGPVCPSPPHPLTSSSPLALSPADGPTRYQCTPAHTFGVHTGSRQELCHRGLRGRFRLLCQLSGALLSRSLRLLLSRSLRLLLSRSLCLLLSSPPNDHMIMYCSFTTT